MRKDRLCDTVLSCYLLRNTAYVPRKVFNFLNDLKEGYHLHKNPTEYLRFLISLSKKRKKSKGDVCPYRLWLSAVVYPRLRKEFLKDVPWIGEYKKIRKKLLELYEKERMEVWERELIIELKREKKFTFLETLKRAFHEKGLYLDLSYVKRFSLLTMSDFAFIAFTAPYFSQSFSRKLNALLFTWYYNSFSVRNPLCQTAKQKLLKILDPNKVKLEKPSWGKDVKETKKDT